MQIILCALLLCPCGACKSPNACDFTTSQGLCVYDHQGAKESDIDLLVSVVEAEVLKHTQYTIEQVRAAYHVTNIHLLTDPRDTLDLPGYVRVARARGRATTYTIRVWEVDACRQEGSLAHELLHVIEQGLHGSVERAMTQHPIGWFTAPFSIERAVEARLYHEMCRGKTSQVDGYWTRRA